jgi:hypothetical protein
MPARDPAQPGRRKKIRKTAHAGGMCASAPRSRLFHAFGAANTPTDNQPRVIGGFKRAANVFDANQVAIRSLLACQFEVLDAECSSRYGQQEFETFVAHFSLQT